MLVNEIKKNTSLIRTLTKKLNENLLSFKNLVFWIDFTHLKRLIDSNSSTTFLKVAYVHEQKLRKLGYVKPNTSLRDKCIFNFSSRPLSSQEKDVLCKGLKFSLPCNNPRFLSHFLPFEKLARHLSRVDIFTREGKTIDHMKHSLKHIALSFFYSKLTPFQTLAEEELSVLKELKNYKNIVVCKPDKGNGVVIFNRNEYNEKMEDILSDSTKFKQVSEPIPNILLKYKDKVNYFLRGLL